MIARPEQERATVVVRLRFVDPHHFAPGRRIDHVRIPGRDLPLGHDALVIEREPYRDRHGEVRCPSHWLTRVSISLSIAGARGSRESGMERDAEETTFVVVRAERDQPAGEVEER